MKMTVLPIIHNLLVGESSSKELLLVPWGFIASTGKRVTMGWMEEAQQAGPSHPSWACLLLLPLV